MGWPNGCGIYPRPLFPLGCHTHWLAAGSRECCLGRLPCVLVGLREGAAMRLVLRVLFVEFALSWAMVMAGAVRVAAQIWPFARQSLAAGFRNRAWRMGLGLLVAGPVVAGWPALFLPSQAQNAAGDWLKIAIPWWILLGALSAQLLAATFTRSGSHEAG
jgi:hypothetical protein